MTAVQWYAIESGKLEVERAKGFLTFPQMFNKMLEILNEAKEMERQQITDSYKIGARYALISQSDLALIKGKFPTPEQYYNETFNNK